MIMKEFQQKIEAFTEQNRIKFPYTDIGLTALLDYLNYNMPLPNAFYSWNITKILHCFTEYASIDDYNKRNGHDDWSIEDVKVDYTVIMCYDCEDNCDGFIVKEY